MFGPASRSGSRRLAAGPAGGYISVAAVPGEVADLTKATLLISHLRTQTIAHRYQIHTQDI